MASIRKIICQLTKELFSVSSVTVAIETPPYCLRFSFFWGEIPCPCMKLWNFFPSILLLLSRRGMSFRGSLFLFLLFFLGEGWGAFRRDCSDALLSLPSPVVMDLNRRQRITRKKMVLSFFVIRN